MEYRNRIAWIDWTKTILIFLVVLGHNSLPNCEKTWIYGFHMPAFFIISGYLYKPKNWTHTIRSFVVPIVFFSVIRFVFYALNQSVKGCMVWDSCLIERCLLPFFKSNVTNEVTLFSGIWFIVCLLMCRLLCGDVTQKLSVKYIFVLSVSSFIFMTVEKSIPHIDGLKDWFVYRTFACIPFFGMGVIWKLYKKAVLTMSFFSILCLLVLYSATVYLQGNIEMYSGNYGCNYAVFYLIAICGSFALFGFATHIQRKKFSVYFSIGTLLILGMHKLMMNVFEILGGRFLSNEVVASTIYTLLVMGLCYYPIKVCRKKIPILLGK